MAAEQRKGRAGRVGPGHVYRLYSSAFFDQQLPRFQAPAILSAPLEDLLLQMKHMGIHDVDAFPFPTPPPVAAVKKAQDLLLNLGALAMSDSQRELSSMDVVDFIKKGRATEGLPGSAVVTQEEIDRFLLSQQSKSHITELGALMAKFPLSPRFSKMLVVACRSAESGGVKGASAVLSSRLVQFSLSFIAALSEKSPFMARHDKTEDSDGSSEEGSDDEVADDKEAGDLAYHPQGDILARMRAFCAYSYACCSANDFPGSKKTSVIADTSRSAGETFCRKHRLHQPTLQRSFDLRNQISKVLAKSLFGITDGKDIESPAVSQWWSMAPASAEEEAALRQIMLSGYCDCIARKATLDMIKVGGRRKRLTAYISCDSSVSEPLYLHPASALYRKDPSAQLPEYVLYDSLTKNKRGDVTYMSGVTVVQKQWIAAVAASSRLVKWSPPLSSPLPYYDSSIDSILCYCTPKYGPHGWELPVAKRRLAECTTEARPGKERDDASVPVGFRKCDEKYRWFARLLLEGQILTDNSELRELLVSGNMLDSPAAITQMRPLPKVVSLVAELVNHRVDSKTRLLECLRTRPALLATEIGEFLKPILRARFSNAWNNVSLI